MSASNATPTPVSNQASTPVSNQASTPVSNQASTPTSDPLTKDSVLKEFVKFLEQAYTVNVTSQGLDVLRSGQYKLNFKLESTKIKDDNAKLTLYNAPKDFLRAIKYYKKYNIAFSAIASGENTLNWSDPIQRIISHMWLYSDVLASGAKQLIFVDSNILANQVEVDKFVRAFKCEGSYKLVVYNYDRKDWSEKFRYILSDDMYAVHNLNKTRVEYKYINFLISQFIGGTSEQKDKRKQLFANLLNNKCFDITEFKRDVCDLFQIDFEQCMKFCTDILGKQDEFIDKVSINTFPGADIGDQIDHLINDPVVIDYEIVKQTELLKIKEKHSLTDAQFAQLNLWLSLPQTNPEQFSLDQIIKNIKENTNTGWQLLMKNT
jgi:hypothetical protein